MASKKTSSGAVELRGYALFLEDTLGELDGVVMHDAANDSLPFRLLQWSNQPFEEVSTVISWGIAEKLMEMPSQQVMREELLVSIAGEEEIDLLATKLSYVGAELLKQDEALLPGHVVGPYDTPFGESDKCGFIVASPVYFPEAIACCEDSTPETYLVWLVPITASEAEYVFEEGADAFLEKMQECDPDVLDLYRPAIV